jgi:uncharacterized protein YndB with AHSA1/START domain
MTEKKAQKRAIRARMSKTGERYTTARRHLTKKGSATLVADPGVSDDAIRNGSGRDWAEWLRILDAWGARQRSHAEIARFLHDDQGIDGWWAQTVAVGYERARGLRAPYQTATGFQVSITKTMQVDVATLFRAFVDPRQRDRWLERGSLRARTTQTDRSARFDYLPDGSRVNVGFTDKGSGKSTVAIQHERLGGSEMVEDMRGFWKERLGRLADWLQTPTR